MTAIDFEVVLQTTIETERNVWQEVEIVRPIVLVVPRDQVTDFLKPLVAESIVVYDFCEVIHCGVELPLSAVVIEATQCKSLHENVVAAAATENDVELLELVNVNCQSWHVICEMETSKDCGVYWVDEVIVNWTGLVWSVAAVVTVKFFVAVQETDYEEVAQ